MDRPTLRSADTISVRGDALRDAPDSGESRVNLSVALPRSEQAFARAVVEQRRAPNVAEGDTLTPPPSGLHDDVQTLLRRARREPARIE
jgi:hypothetical protein